MDMETGEYYQDIETGEISYNSQDAETGESQGRPTRRFKVPRSYYTKKNRESFRPFKATEQELELITAVIFLLPTMVVFHPLIAIFALCAEIFLHHYSHEKNKRLKTDAFYFRSPLHGILKEFCARCKDDRASMKITKLQDIRNDKMKRGLDCLKRVVT